MSYDPTVQEHLGDLYQKTGRLKLAAAHWDRAVQEWNKTVPAEQDSDAFAKVQQKLDAAKSEAGQGRVGQAVRAFTHLRRRRVAYRVSVRLSSGHDGVNSSPFYPLCRKHLFCQSPRVLENVTEVSRKLSQIIVSKCLSWYL